MTPSARQHTSPPASAAPQLSTRQRAPARAAQGSSPHAPTRALLPAARSPGTYLGRRCNNGSLVPASIADAPVDPTWAPVWLTDTQEDALAALPQAAAFAVRQAASQVRTRSRRPPPPPAGSTHACTCAPQVHRSASGVCIRCATLASLPAVVVIARSCRCRRCRCWRRPSTRRNATCRRPRAPWRSTRRCSCGEALWRTRQRRRCPRWPRWT